MDTNTEYKVVEGDKKTFEAESNRLAKEGWIWCGGSLVMQPVEKGFWYAQLMSKYIPPKQ
jgi:hypothetical protein